MPQLKFALVLAMVIAIGPFAIDTYLPAFPYIAKSLHRDINAVEFSVSIYVFGLAIGQLLGGPLSDRGGRSKIMMIGLLVFSVASFFLAFSHTLTELLWWRGIQAFGGGWALVTVPAVVRDHYEGEEAAKMFGLIGLIMIIAPAIAPSIGTLILHFSAWPGVFVFLGAYATLAMILAKWIVFAKPEAKKIATEKINFVKQYLDVLKLNVAIYFLLLQSFATGIMLVFLTHASFIYQEYFRVSNVTFSIFFILNILTMACFNRLSRLLLKWFKPYKILITAVGLQAIGVLALSLVAKLHPTLFFFVPILMITVGTLGAISPNIQACYLQFYPKNSGAAAALLGAAQLGLGGMISAFSAFIANGTLISIVLTMGICATFSVVCGWRINALMLPKESMQMRS